MITEYAQKTVRTCMKIFCLIPIKRNRIFFSSQKGTQYACNPRYIYEHLVEKYGNRLDFVWCINNPSGDIRGKRNLKIVSYNSLSYFYNHMTSKVIVSNIPIPCYVPKRNSQFMIDTWHGGGAYKKFGISVPKQKSLSELKGFIKTTEASDNTKWELYKAYYNAKDTNLFVLSCRLFRDVIHEAMLIPHDICFECGTPRNDIFFKDYHLIGKKAKAKLGIETDKKVILFAPTYRGNLKNQRNDIMLDIQMCLDAAKERWGGEWVFVYRMHIFSSSLDRDKIPANAINASGYDEMQELLCMADVFITDYSSSLWDFSMTRKPGFLFTPDLEYYIHEDRGFYVPIDDWAFPYAKTNEELAGLIINFEENKHLQKIQRHLDMLGSFEDGHATEKVCDLIMKQMKL